VTARHLTGGRPGPRRKDQGVIRIDVHAHYWTDDYLDLLVDLGKTDAGAARS
jgi:hypothetical protein